MLLQLLVGFCEQFQKTLDGTTDLSSDTSVLKGGAHIQAVFADLVRELTRIQILRVVPPNDFKTTVKNCIGVGTFYILSFTLHSHTHSNKTNTQVPDCSHPPIRSN